MTNPFEHPEVKEQERSADSMATYPGRVVKATYAHRLAAERDDLKLRAGKLLSELESWVLADEVKPPPYVQRQIDQLRALV